MLKHGHLDCNIHEIALNRKSWLKTQLIFLSIFANHILKQPKTLHFKICQMIYPFNTFIM